MRPDREHRRHSVPAQLRAPTSPSPASARGPSSSAPRWSSATTTEHVPCSDRNGRRRMRATLMMCVCDGRGPRTCRDVRRHRQDRQPGVDRSRQRCPIRGTSCKTDRDAVQSRCLAGSTQATARWDAETCPGGARSHVTVFDRTSSDQAPGTAPASRRARCSARPRWGFEVGRQPPMMRRITVSRSWSRSCSIASPSSRTWSPNPRQIHSRAVEDEQAFDVLLILRPPCDCLVDHEVFRLGDLKRHTAHPDRPGRRHRLQLERHPRERDVDVNTGLGMTQ